MGVYSMAVPSESLDGPVKRLKNDDRVQKFVGGEKRGCYL